MKPKVDGVKFRWRCPDCNRRNMVFWNAVFDMPESYSGEYQCSHCGTAFVLALMFEVRRPRRNKCSA